MVGSRFEKFQYPGNYIADAERQHLERRGLGKKSGNIKKEKEKDEEAVVADDEKK